MRLTADELEARLTSIASRVAGMLANPNAFPRAFEDETERLLDQVAPSQQVYVLERLEAIVQRSGFSA